MDYPKAIQDLLSKYWDGETSLEEEGQLHQYFTARQDTSPEAIYFQFLMKEKEITTDFHPAQKRTVRRTLTFSTYLRYAAVFLCLAVAGFLAQKYVLQGPEPDQQTAMYRDSFDDPEKAYAEAKEALLLVAQKLNATQNKVSKQLSVVEPYSEIIKD